MSGLIEYKEWYQHHRSPTPSEIRRVAYSKEPGCTSFLVEKGGKLFIDEMKLMEYLTPERMKKYRIGENLWKKDH